MVPQELHGQTDLALTWLPAGGPARHDAAESELSISLVRFDRSQIMKGVRQGAFALIGAYVALVIAGNVHARIGPFDTTVSVRPALSGHTTVRLAPLGSIQLATHHAPVEVELRVDELRLDNAERIASDPSVLQSLEGDISSDARRALVAVGLRSLLVATLGAAIGALAASARWRRTLLGAGGGALLVGAVGLWTATTFNPRAVAEPRYSGLMTVAPTAVGDLEAVVNRVGEYRAQLTELVGNVVTLYRTAQGLPTVRCRRETVRVLHVSDIHLNPQAFDLMALLVDQFDIDVIADTGDITDWGSEPEARLVERIGTLGVPYVWVRGNHDSATTQARRCRTAECRRAGR